MRAQIGSVVVTCVALAFAPAGAAAQESGRLVGVVVSEARGLPIPGALVALDAGLETLADGDGVFLLDAVRAGLYRIAAVAPGCHVGLGDVQVEPGRELRMRVTVPLTVEEENRLEEWTLGTRSLGESVRALTGEQIRKRHIRTVQDAVRILAPAMVGQETNQVGGRTMLRNRGAPTILSSAEPLVILDGIQIAQGSVDALAGIDPGDIELIEVLRGGTGGWRYGLQGANGVVRITTRDASGGYAEETPPPECAFRFTR